ncbi:hypothetical protein P4U99_23750 [Brevibacillus agri]|nr:MULTISPECIES: hypothetical protein [Brevibacillus]EJL41613.1 hypothetical protein PMI08_03667 [Brevibacillus sp. CF112]MDN4095807.1 hypothetical protein [Brevibacillus agri]MDR9507036.1 hypothetical protein [Brevibacillus agri]MED1646161.1 hypothetical protein [Brevibacillus agri]MED1656147.1 hypothetical protein [Brevibacillus agri]
MNTDFQTLIDSLAGELVYDEAKRVVKIFGSVGPVRCPLQILAP